MKRRSIVFTVLVVVMASVGLTSTAMPAEQFHGGLMAGGRAPVSPPILPHGFAGHPNLPHHVVAVPRPHPHPFFPHRIIPHRFGSHRFGPHRFVASGVFGGSVIAFASTTAYPPPIVYAAPVLPYAAGAYADNESGNYNSPAVYTPPAGGTVAAAPAPMPNVIQYGTGRYELRGDGLAIPYTWVWIPNPPPAPPSAAPTGANVPGDSPPSRGQVFRWTDSQGVLHMTDRWESVPTQYRPQAKQNLPS